MGTPWCDAFPVVQIPSAPEPKRVTFIYPYYCNPDFLRRHIAWWHTYPSWRSLYLSAILVDDGSPQFPLSASLPAVLPFPIRAFRVGVDIRWNWIAARNIGMHHAPEGWCLLTDMDHVIPETTAKAVIQGAHNPEVIYGFSRIEHTGAQIPPHPNSWLMTREMFWRVGGYDETLSGFYGTDGDWRRRCARVAPIQILSDRLIRHEYQGDSSTTRYRRKQEQDAKVKGLIAARPKVWRPKVLSFPYAEIRLGVGSVA